MQKDIQVEIIAIGDEVLAGYTINANAAFIAKKMGEAGFAVRAHRVVGDRAQDVEDALRSALANNRIVITTGGLGPTLDDLTRKLAASVFGVELIAHPTLLPALEARYGAGFPTLQDQILLPKGCKILDNPLGTASGFILQDQKRFGKSMLICLPGVPLEMQAMLTKEVLPSLTRSYTTQKSYTKALHFLKMGEHQLDPTLRHIHEAYPDLSYGIYPGYGTVTVLIKGEDEQRVEQAAKPFYEQFANRMYDSPSGKLSEAVHLELIRQKRTLATCESCTGGALGASFVANPDASKYFQGGIIAYSNAIKEELVGVASATLKEHGAVSRQVTEQMAKGVQEKFHTDIGIGVSGILGPSGGSQDKPVGTICASIAYSKAIHSWVMHLRGDRQLNLERCVNDILAELYLLLKETSC